MSKEITIKDQIEVKPSAEALFPSINKFYENINESLYHGDKRFVNSSSLKHILKSPQHYLKAVNESITPTQSMEWGTLIHKAILEGESFINDLVVSIDFGDQRVKINREKKAAFEAENSGKIVVQESELFNIQTILQNLEKHNDAMSILKNAKCEMSGVFLESESNIRCKIRPDIYNEKINALFDVKSSKDIHIDEFSKSIWNFRYDIQNAFYRLGIDTITNKKIEHSGFLVVESSEPFSIAVYVCDDTILNKGSLDCRRALDLLKKCLDSGNWNSYQESAQSISLPYWALNK